MKNQTRMNWQDVYYDGKLDVEYEIFNEETQSVSKLKKQYTNNCWNMNSNKKYIEDYSDDYYKKLMSGEIERII